MSLLDLVAEDPGLVDMIKAKPSTFLPELEKAATRLAKEENAIQLHNLELSHTANGGDEPVATSAIPIVQVLNQSLAWN